MRPAPSAPNRRRHPPQRLAPIPQSLEHTHLVVNRLDVPTVRQSSAGRPPPTQATADIGAGRGIYEVGADRSATTFLLGSQQYLLRNDGPAAHATGGQPHPST